MVRAPRVNDRRIVEATGERKRFASAILPAWAPMSPRVAEVLPLLYLHGLSSGDFSPALEQFLGTSHGLSAVRIKRLTKQHMRVEPRTLPPTAAAMRMETTGTELLDHIQHKPHQMTGRQPLSQRGRHQKLLITIHRTISASHTTEYSADPAPPHPPRPAI